MAAEVIEMSIRGEDPPRAYLMEIASQALDQAKVRAMPMMVPARLVIS